MNIPNHRPVFLVFRAALAAAILSAGCGRPATEERPITTVSPATAATETFRRASPDDDFPGLATVQRVTDRLYSGGVPEGDKGFESLQRLGICTVISVDGARPDVE